MRKRFLIITIVILAVSTIVLAFVINQELVKQHMYPQDAINENSNLAVRGIVTSIEENHESQGFAITSYTCNLTKTSLEIQMTASQHE